MSDLKICPTCGTEYPLSERFCPRDGTALRSASPTADLLGQIVADRFHVVKKLGEGGMGTVYLAEHVKMGRKCALKVMNPGMNTDPDAIARFNREAANASRLSHPNICGIYDFGETPDGLIYLAMEFIEGTSLSSLVEKDGALPPARAGSIIHQTADALQVAHDAGIVHRDLKPDNIMIARNRDGTDLVKVVDFGIAKASSSDAQKVTKTGLVVGTPEYMSPEQLAGDKLDGRSDTYSLGLVAFNCLTGTLPFASESAQEAMIMRLTDEPRKLAEVKPDADWPEALQATLDHALARSTDQRYQSASQFGREFAAAIRDMPMTQAIEAGTQVVAAASAAKHQVPATRVARPSSRTEVVDSTAMRGAGGKAASQPQMEKKGLGTGVKVAGFAVPVIAVAVYVALQGGLGGAGGAVTPPVNPPANSPTAAESTTTTPAKAANPEPNRPGSTQTRPPVNPPAPTNPNAAPTNTQLLAGWISELDSGPADTLEATRVLRELNTVFFGLEGEQLADGWYIRMQAYATLEDERTCDAAREVQRRSSDARKKRVAGEYFTSGACT